MAPDTFEHDLRLGRLVAFVGALLCATGLCVASYLEVDGVRLHVQEPERAACPTCGPAYRAAPLDGATELATPCATRVVGPGRPS